MIASKVDKKSGKILSPNCYGAEKVNRLNNEINNYHVVNSFSDSLSDEPILKLADNAYIVKGDVIIKYEEK